MDKELRLYDLARQGLPYRKIQEVLKREYGSGYRKKTALGMIRQELSRPKKIASERYIPKKFVDGKIAVISFETRLPDYPFDEIEFLRLYRKTMSSRKADIITSLDDITPPLEDMPKRKEYVKVEVVFVRTVDEVISYMAIKEQHTKGELLHIADFSITAKKEIYAILYTGVAYFNENLSVSSLSNVRSAIEAGGII